jgi:hypothetical protein
VTVKDPKGQEGKKKDGMESWFYYGMMEIMPLFS